MSMNNSQGPKRVTSPKRSQTADALSSKSYEQPAEKRQTSPRGRRPMSFASPRAFSPSRYNKLYRCPPTPPPEVQFDRERSFVLDCAAVSNISADYSRTNPKLGSVIRPYNAQLDQSAQNYFRFGGVDQTLKRTGQVNKDLSHRRIERVLITFVTLLQFGYSESIAGRVHDRFFDHGHGFRYLSLRNQFGAGRQETHSRRNRMRQR